MKALALTLAVLITLAFASVVEAGFPKGRQYMSSEGYARWQAYLRTGSWN